MMERLENDGEMENDGERWERRGGGGVRRFLFCCRSLQAVSGETRRGGLRRVGARALCGDTGRSGKEGDRLSGAPLPRRAKKVWASSQHFSGPARAPAAARPLPRPAPAPRNSAAMARMMDLPEAQELCLEDAPVRALERERRGSTENESERARLPRPLPPWSARPRSCRSC